MLRGENTPCRRRRARENKLDSRLRILKYEECATPPQAADGRKMKTRKHGVSACALLVACVSAVSAIAGTPCDSIYNINEAKHLDLYAPCLGDVQSSFGDLAYEIEENAIYCLQNQENNNNFNKPQTHPEPREQATSALSENVKVSSRIHELLFKDSIAKSPKKVALGGSVFGIKIKQSNVTVQEAKGVPALSAGDVILSINGTAVKTAAEASRLISSSGGESITLKVSRRGVPITLQLRPTKQDGTYTLGITLRDGAMGIGTMTFYDPETGLFGGLGHSVCDTEGSAPIEMQSGEISGALLGGVKKGECGKPGELSGILTGDRLGTLYSNNECGVFGYLETVPTPDRIIEVGTKSELHEGEATVISTLKNGKTAEYKIKIYDINKNAQGSKCFRIKVTDEVLLALSGGIVRGMSGSPIIQDGKLVGAVTHVMVADPTEGYGIFIENMLNAAEMPMAKAS